MSKGKKRKKKGHMFLVSDPHTQIRQRGRTRYRNQIVQSYSPTELVRGRRKDLKKFCRKSVGWYAIKLSPTTMEHFKHCKKTREFRII
jgi:hypothetical protein